MKIFLDCLVALIDSIDMIVFQLLKVMVELFDADSLMIGNPLLMTIIDPLETIEADAAIEVTLIIDSDELERFIVLVAGVDAKVHQ